MQPKLEKLAAAHRNLMRCAKRFARNGQDSGQFLIEFRDSQKIFEQLLDDREISETIDNAIREMSKLNPGDDLSTFIREYLTNECFDEEVKLSCFIGMKRSEVEEFLRSIEIYSKSNNIIMPPLNSSMIKQQFSNSCDRFVTLVCISCSLDKRAKKRMKLASRKGLTVISLGGICAAVDAALAFPTIGILPTISFGITAGSTVLSAQYLIDARHD